MRYLIAKVNERQRAEAWETYVSDSLFFIQHILGGNEHDENRTMHTARFIDIIKEAQNPKPRLNSEEIIERMLKKSEAMTRNKT